MQVSEAAPASKMKVSPTKPAAKPSPAKTGAKRGIALEFTAVTLLLIHYMPDLGHSRRKGACKGVGEKEGQLRKSHWLIVFVNVKALSAASNVCFSAA